MGRLINTMSTKDSYLGLVSKSERALLVMKQTRLMGLLIQETWSKMVREVNYHKCLLRMMMRRQIQMNSMIL